MKKWTKTTCVLGVAFVLMGNLVGCGDTAPSQGEDLGASGSDVELMEQDDLDGDSEKGGSGGGGKGSGGDDPSGGTGGAADPGSANP